MAAQPQARRAIAVIGLRNLTGSPGDQWLSTALAEMLSSELATNDKLRVISGEEIANAGLAAAPERTPSRETLARYAKQLGADAIVFGSYTVSREHKAAPSMRLDLQLEDVSSDAPAMVLVETGETSNLFSLVAASGTQLRERFGLGAVAVNSDTGVKRTLPTNPEAAEYFAEGLGRLRSILTHLAR